MGAGHAHPLYHHGHSRVHRLAPEVKVAATLLFVLLVAVTPRELVLAFVVDAVVLAVVIWMADLPLRFVAARLAIIVPFVLFALLVPFIAGGEQVEILGASLSRDGLWSTWNILAKAALGATASIVLAGTTEQSRILAGLERLRVPRVMTTIAAFMLRYLELLADEVRRVRTAMTARGYDPRWVTQAKPMASAAGALFIRSYERGERVHAGMLARGFTGSMPELARRERPTSGEWLAVLAVASLPALSALVVWFAR